MQNGWLTGWKDIAKYIGRCTKTAQMYARTYHMPVRHLPGAVQALPYEIDQWLIEFDKIKKKKRKNKSNFL